MTTITVKETKVNIITTPATKSSIINTNEGVHTPVITAITQGPAGKDGSKLTSYAHTQPIASATWTINHNLDMFPNVTVLDSAGTMVVGNIQYLNKNTVILTFSAAFAGVAYLS